MKSISTRIVLNFALAVLAALANAQTTNAGGGGD